MSKNLTPEELQNLQALNQEFTQVKLKLADSVYQQVLFTKDLDTIREKFSSVEKELSEKYGANSVIDLATGEVKENQPAETAEVIE
jgi:oligoribonuclease NrnB/cAMP/cGMP phosphodiesterase (DHH superfamily)